mmetsp:Transcript_16002/g.34621  ORF Transcript_16002/g.34621 Transcript_16002/m.34621 type:complete len:284 (-) Transcript_16002:1223-2074(-)
MTHARARARKKNLFSSSLVVLLRLMITMMMLMSVVDFFSLMLLLLEVHSSRIYFHAAEAFRGLAEGAPAGAQHILCFGERNDIRKRKPHARHFARVAHARNEKHAVSKLILQLLQHRHRIRRHKELGAGVVLHFLPHARNEVRVRALRTPCVNRVRRALPVLLRRVHRVDIRHQPPVSNVHSHHVAPIDHPNRLHQLHHRRVHMRQQFSQRGVLTRPLRQRRLHLVRAFEIDQRAFHVLNPLSFLRIRPVLLHVVVPAGFPPRRVPFHFLHKRPLWLELVQHA